MVRDFNYVSDINEGIIHIIDNPPSIKMSTQVDSNTLEASGQKLAAYKIYNIGNSSPVQLTEFIDAIEHHLGKKATKEYLPMQAGDVPRTEADVSDLVKNLGFKPDTTVQKGIGEFIEWYKAYFNI